MVDVFAKYGWIIMLKDKQGISVSKAINDIFSKIKEKTNIFWSDKGKELYNKHVKQL